MRYPTRVPAKHIGVWLMISLGLALSACGDNGKPAFEINVTGALEAALQAKTDLATIEFAPVRRLGVFAQLPTHTLMFSRSGDEQDIAAAITFYGIYPPESGTYEIATSLGFSGTVIASLSDRKTLTTYGSSPKGTITITKVEDLYSGEFSFTVAKFDGTGSVTVGGTFNNIPLSPRKTPVSEDATTEEPEVSEEPAE